MSLRQKHQKQWQGNNWANARREILRHSLHVADVVWLALEYALPPLGLRGSIGTFSLGGAPRAIQVPTCFTSDDEIIVLRVDGWQTLRRVHDGYQLSDFAPLLFERSTWWMWSLDPNHLLVPHCTPHYGPRVVNIGTTPPSVTDLECEKDTTSADDVNFWTEDIACNTEARILYYASKNAVRSYSLSGSPAVLRRVGTLLLKELNDLPNKLLTMDNSGSLWMWNSRSRRNASASTKTHAVAVSSLDAHHCPVAFKPAFTLDLPDQLYPSELRCRGDFLYVLFTVQPSETQEKKGLPPSGSALHVYEKTGQLVHSLRFPLEFQDLSVSDDIISLTDSNVLMIL